jgi:hypothetical protein
MIVLAPGSDAIWDYRRAPVGRIVDAVRAMLLARRRVRPLRSVQ